MKKLSIPLIILSMLLFVFPAGAQYGEIGVMGGLNFGNLSENPKEEGVDLSSRTDMLIGPVAVVNFTNNISLMFAPAYVQKGSSVFATGQDSSFGKIETEQKWKLNYLDIPVLLRAAFGNTGAVRPYLMAGPNFAFLLNAKAVAEKLSIDGVSQDIGEAEVSISEFFKNVDIGINLGGGINFPLGNYHLFLEAMYNLGIANIADMADTVDEFEIKNRGFQIRLGILIPAANGVLTKSK